MQAECYMGGMVTTTNFIIRERIKNGLHLSDWAGKNIHMASNQFHIDTDEHVFKDI